MAERFAADWLDAREPADHAARPAALTERLIDSLAAGQTLRIADLGAGAGSNLRYLAPRLPQPQAWWLIDHDPALLARATAQPPTLPGAPGPGSIRITPRAADLTDLPACLPAGLDLVTAAALLDLVSQAWIERLAEHCQRARLPALLALSFDGRIRFSPRLPDDEALVAALIAHQRGTKDMGRALGPDAAERTAAAFRQRGALVSRARSDWLLTPARAGLQRMLLAGWHAAAVAERPALAERFDSWLARRLAALDRSRIRVGHQDLLALPCRG